MTRLTWDDIPAPDTTPAGDTTTAREALRRAMYEHATVPAIEGDNCVCGWEGEDFTDHLAPALLAGPLSDPAVVAQLPGVAGLVRGRDEAREKLTKVDGLLDEWVHTGTISAHALLGILRGTP